MRVGDIFSLGGDCGDYDHHGGHHYGYSDYNDYDHGYRHHDYYRSYHGGGYHYGGYRYHSGGLLGLHISL